ncbi:MAG: acyl-CoA dehydrogenase family protein, partial [Acidobacteriota bacterium]
MNVDLSPDQQAIRDSVREFAREQVAPGAAERDQTAEFPVELVKQCAEMGLMGVSIPTEWEGAGLDSVSYALVVEELSAACASVGVIVSVNNSLACEPILDWGTDEQKKKYLTELASGRLLGAYAPSEPEAGS